MKVFTLVCIVCVALSHCYADPIKDQERIEEDVYNKGNLTGLLDLYSQTTLQVPPGRDPIVLTGKKDGVMLLKWIKSVGVDHYHSEIFQEYDMGSHTLQMGHYKAMNKDNIYVDEGTMLKLFQRVDGKLRMKIIQAASIHTPWPVRKP